MYLQCKYTHSELERIANSIRHVSTHIASDRESTHSDECNTHDDENELKTDMIIIRIQSGAKAWAYKQQKAITSEVAGKQVAQAHT